MIKNTNIANNIGKIFVYIIIINYDITFTVYIDVISIIFEHKLIENKFG
jgi:hypothetical protein